MAVRVKGVLDGVAYEVEVTGDRSRPVTGSRRVAALLEQWTGRPVRVTPTGPELVVSHGDVRSVVAALRAGSTVKEVTGDAPELPPIPRTGVA